MFRIEMLPAGHGDSILIEYGKENETKKILIDAGPWYAFDNLLTRFKALADEKASIELFVVTHVDCDHIDGAITILKPDQTKLKVEQVWFNSYKHLSDELGAPEGDILSALIGEKNTPWNTPFGGKAAALVDNTKLREKTLDGGLRLTLLSPTRTELEKLKPDWDKACKQAHIAPGSEVDALERLKEDEEKAKKYITPRPTGRRKPEPRPTSTEALFAAHNKRKPKQHSLPCRIRRRTQIMLVRRRCESSSNQLINSHLAEATQNRQTKTRRNKGLTSRKQRKHQPENAKNARMQEIPNLNKRKNLPPPPSRSNRPHN